MSPHKRLRFQDCPEGTDEERTKVIQEEHRIEMASFQKQIEELTKTIDILGHGLREVQILLDHSEGVAGLHQNGDVASWGDLLKGGCCEGWLIGYSEALQELGRWEEIRFRQIVQEFVEWAGSSTEEEGSCENQKTE